jgi:leucyl/phenylalanyl-tRNA--protein transferase
VIRASAASDWATHITGATSERQRGWDIGRHSGTPRRMSPRRRRVTSAASPGGVARARLLLMVDADAPPDSLHAPAAQSAPATADWPDGLVAIGGELNPETLVRAYRSGIFPWSSDPAVTWWSPDPRAIFDLDGFRPHRSLRKTIRRAGWRFTTDQDFQGVMRACAAPTPERPSTWITEDFVNAYTALHREGMAHSVEVWEGPQVVGGLYGVTLGGFFGGESMFHRRTDASKAAVAFLVEHLRARGFVLLDAQVPNEHLERLGAIEISRASYLHRLQIALATPARF